MSGNRRAALFSCLLLAAGCVDPMTASDGVSPVAGIAPRHNVEVQTVNPGAGYRQTANPGGEGQRISGVIDRYQTGAPADPQAPLAQTEGEEG